MSDEQQSSDKEISDEYEEISSEEVDRVVEILEELAESVSSENIRVLLEEASQSVYDLVYDEEDEVEGEAEIDESTDDLIETDDLVAEDEGEETAEAA